MIAEAAGDLDAAISHYRDAVDQAIKVSPEYLVPLARALRVVGEKDEAIAVLEEALKIEPAHPAYQLELAHLQHQRGNLVQANKHLSVALVAWAEAGPEYQPAQEARQLADLLSTP